MCETSDIYIDTADCAQENEGREGRRKVYKFQRRIDNPNTT
jgi:hypothetical protein